MTEALVILTFLVWSAWDLYAFANGGESVTITHVVRSWTRFPLVAFGLGVLAGHLVR